MSIYAAIVQSQCVEVAHQPAGRQGTDLRQQGTRLPLRSAAISWAVQALHMLQNNARREQSIHE